jgi:hypothetical protein
MFANVCCLSAVCEEETRIRISKPTDLHRSTTEGANICKERFNTSETKQNASQASPAVVLIANEVIKSVVWIEALQHQVVVSNCVSSHLNRECSGNLLGKVVHAKACIESKPQHDDRREDHGQF